MSPLKMRHGSDLIETCKKKRNLKAIEGSLMDFNV